MNSDARPRPATLVRIGVSICVLVGAMLLLPIGDVRGGVSRPLAFGAAGSLAAVLDLLTGQLLLASGVLAWLVGPRARVGTLAVLAGIAWFGPDLFAVEGADPMVRAIGRFGLGPLLLPLLLHLSMAALGVDGGRVARAGLLAAYLAAIAVAVGGAVSYDAFLDLYCIDCDWANPFLNASDYRLVRAWRLTGAALTIAISVAAGATVIRRLAASSPMSAAQVVIGLGTLGWAIAALMRGLLMVTAPKEDPLTLPWWVAWIVLILSVLIIAVGVGALAVETWRRTIRMRSIGDSLEAAPAPGTLEGALRRALGDPVLRLAYRLDDGSTVDADGAPFDPTSGPGQLSTPVERDGMQIAQILHAPSVDAGALAEAFGPALLVALDNERLRAARLAQLGELRASRTRIVAVGDAERRRLERDLHDGVQQLLLSVLFDLRLARLAAERSGDHLVATRLGEAEGLARDVVDELRRIAHGIHPAVLSRSGLGPALASLAEESSMPVDVMTDGVGRLPDAVEAAAYQVVTDAVAASTAAGAEGLVIRAAADGATLTLEIREDGVRDAALSDAEVPVPIADRVAAAGGRMTAEWLATGGRFLRVELPCG